MPAQIRPNRLVVNDRFPMLGFTVRTDVVPKRAEITIATDPALFSNPGQRKTSNFFSTSEIGGLTLNTGQSTFVVPVEILARFIGAEKLYFALATAPAANGADADFTVEVAPTENSPYISIADLTGRSLRRIRMLPARNAQTANGYENGNGRLTWAGDRPVPGTRPVNDQPTARPPVNGNGSVAAPSNGNGSAARNGNGATNGHSPAVIDYDDGFGPMPPPPGAAASPAAPVAATPSPAPAAQALGAGSFSIGAMQDSSAPEVQALGHIASTAIQIALAANPALTPTIVLARGIAEAADVSVGVGPKIGAGLLGGAGLGVGIIFAPGNRLGVYGAAEIDGGFIAGLSATLQITVLRGGIDSFEGISRIASVSAGEGIVGGVSAIFDASNNFLGISIEGGIGAGLSPLEIFTGVQRGIASQLGYAAAYGLGGVPAYAMIIGPDDVEQAQRYAPAWRDLFNWTVPAAVDAEVRRRGMSVQRIQDAHGALNLDKYEVRCTRLPTGYTAESLLDHFRKNINAFVDTDNTEFNPYSAADSSKWAGGSPVGAIFNLDIIGPDNAAVVGSLVEPRRFRFTTIETPDTGSHPVSGHREFGVRTEGNAHIFYTRGADRATHGMGETLVFAGADHLWKSFQNRLSSFINSNGGSASVLSRFSERFHPEVVRILYGGSSAQALGAGFDPLAFEVKYRMFIPSPVVSGPFSTDYGGDGRGFSYDTGTSRGELTATVRLTPGMGIDGVDLIDRHWGESTGYDGDDTVHVSGKPSWWLDKKAGAQPSERATLAVDNDNLRIYSGVPSQRGVRVYAEGASAVTVLASGGMPLSSIAPAIDADVSILFRNRNGVIQAKALGQHDGFPAHELYVNGEVIYRYDPVAADNTPTSLVGWGDVDVDSDWVNVGRVYTVRTGAQGHGATALGAGESYTLNWDEVQLVAQPTDKSCWAAAAAMLIGWRDRMSLTPETVANLCGRSTLSSDSFTPAHVADFAAQMGLMVEPPQSYSEEGFRSLLENNGPLWVVKGTPPYLHAILVTGLYKDGSQLYVRVSDPWDRAVGTPGAPGAYAATHSTGSRYIMKWEDFAAEYEAAVTETAGTVNLQIVHAGGTDGRQPNRGPETPPGYAQGLEFNESFTLNWDEVESIAQPTDLSCWATAGAMVIGWRDRISLSPQSVAEIGGRSIRHGLNPSNVGAFAADMGLVTEPPMSYTKEGFRELLESSGPLWVGAAVPSLHVVVVTGLYNEGQQMYVRITDPWDRAVGTPGSPGAYARTHNTGSRYIMRWEDFAAEYEAAAANYASVNLQILHSGGVDGRQPNRGASTPAGYAMTAARNARAYAAEAAAPANGNGGGHAAPANGNGDGKGAPYSATGNGNGNGYTAPSNGNGNGSAHAAPGNGNGNGNGSTYAAPANGNGNGNGNGATATAPGNGNGATSTSPANGNGNGATSAAPGNGNAAGPVMPPSADRPDLLPKPEFPPPGVRVHRSQVETNGVTYDVTHLDGVVPPVMPPAVAANLIPGERVALDDWPYIDGPGGRSRGGVAIDWSYGAGGVANVRVHPSGGQALDNWRILVTGNIAEGPSTPTETKLKLTFRTTFSRDGEASQSGVSEVLLCGSGRFETAHRQEAAAQPPQPTPLPHVAPSSDIAAT